MFFIHELQKSDIENRRYTNSKRFQEGEHCQWISWISS